MPSTSQAPDSAPKSSFGTRCALRAYLNNLIDVASVEILAAIIDGERAALIQKAQSTPLPIDHSDPRQTPTRPVEDFGNRKKIPPTPEQVTGYAAAIGYPLDGQDFCDSYEAKGWKVGKNRMKDWQATVRNWRTNGWGKLLGPKKDTPPKDFTKF
jgi:hypothetical protein